MKCAYRRYALLLVTFSFFRLSTFPLGKGGMIYLR